MRDRNHMCIYLFMVRSDAAKRFIENQGSFECPLEPACPNFLLLWRPSPPRFIDPCPSPPRFIDPGPSPPRFIDPGPPSHRLHSFCQYPDTGCFHRSQLVRSVFECPTQHTTSPAFVARIDGLGRGALQETIIRGTRFFLRRSHRFTVTRDLASRS